MYDVNIVIQVKSLQENGKSYREICEIMKIPKSSVGYILNNRKKGHHLKRGPKCKM